jgi:hypothetical protein
MKKVSSHPNGKLIKDLEKQVASLRVQLKEIKKNHSPEEYIKIKVTKTQENSSKLSTTKDDNIGLGKFGLFIEVTALKETLYVPVSIASSKKSTGFIYQIEGTAKGNISTATVSARGDGITQVILGTIQYCKIPVGKTALFRIFIDIRGKMHKEYKIVITRVNYKLNPSDARYKQLPTEIHSKTLELR